MENLASAVISSRFEVPAFAETTGLALGIMVQSIDKTRYQLV